MHTGKYILMTAAIFAAVTITGPLQAGEQSGNTAMTRQQNQAGNELSTKGIKSSGSNMVLVGELVDSRDVTLKGVDEYKHRLLKVKPADGAQTVIVDIGMQDPAASFGLINGDRVIAVGKSARINQRPVLFAKSIGELYPVGRVGSVARDREQMMQDKSARGATSLSDSHGMASESRTSTTQSSYPKDKDGTTKTANAASTSAKIDPPDTRGVDEIVVWFDSNNLGSDQYGSYDEDFVWTTIDPTYSTWNPPSSSIVWNDNRETPHWDVWGYDDADEWGLFDW